MSSESTAAPRRSHGKPNLTAAAARLTQETVTRYAKQSQGQKGARADAWLAFNQIGEHRFMASTIANRGGQAGFYVGRKNDEPGLPPVPIDETDEKLSDTAKLAVEVWEEFGDTPSHRAQMIARMLLNLFVPGEGWFAGIPRHMVEDMEEADDQPVVEPDEKEGLPPTGKFPSRTGEEAGEPVFNLDDLTWRMLSADEVKASQDGKVTLYLTDSRTTRGSITVDPDDVILFRVWRPHPQLYWEPDSPTISSLPVLRELIGLTMHVSAQIDSRLAGAGILLIPESVRQAILARMNVDPGSEDDPFVDDLIEAMVTPISDRASAAAYVPYVITGPGEDLDKIKHISFSQPLDAESRQLREEAIRRLALSLDAPPELLLGVANMNHWGAWLVREDVITTHVEPPLQLICQALTSEYLHPVMEQMGIAEEDYEQYEIWYTVAHLIGRPNRFADAKVAFDSGTISSAALRAAGQFTDDDAPDPETIGSTVLAMLQNQPSLFADVGVNQLIADVQLLRDMDTQERAEREQADEAEQAIELNEEATEVQPNLQIPATEDDDDSTSEIGTGEAGAA